MNYAKLVPAHSFMGRYLRFMEQQETAYSYDWWCGLWCIAAACGRTTYVARPRAPIFLNMYTVLIGESGVPRKTTSVGSASRLIRDLHGYNSDVGLLDAKMTPERLDEILHERTLEYGSAQLCITVPELAVFLGTERYVATMPTLLTDLYDCASHRHGGGTIARGSRIQRDIWVSFLSASTPIWLLKTVNPNVVEGGFTSRCIFIHSNTPKHKIPWPSSDESTDDYAILLDDLKQVRASAGESQPILLTDAAMSAFSKWYKARPRAYETFKQSFEAREDAHVLRVAALLCINDGTWRIDHIHLTRAIKVVAEVKESSGHLFENSEQRTKYAVSLDKMRAVLISAGMDPVPRHELFRKARLQLGQDEMDALVEVLHEIGAIQRFHAKSESGMGRPTEFFRGTNLLLARGLGEQVLEKFI